MIAFFRRTLGSKFALGLLALIMLAFIITGVFTHEMPGSSGGGGDGGSGVATVGNQTITSNDMEQRIRAQFNQYAQQQPGLDMASFFAQGAFVGIVDQVIGATALQKFGESLGLVASKKQVDGSIAAIPAFHGVDGKFDRKIYLAALAQQRLNDAQVRDDIAGDLLRRMVMLPVTGALTLPDGLIRPYAGMMVEQRAGEIGFVPVALTGGGTAPTDAEIQTFYKSHIAAYTVPERRVLRYALIGRDQVAATALPTEAEVRKAYDAAGDKYAARETRDLSQVVLDSQAKAQAFKAAVTGGKSFADAAKAAGFGAGDIAIGIKSQTQFAGQTSPAVSAAAFALSQGGVSDPVKSDFGWHVVKVDAIQRIPATPYETARPQLAADIAKDKQDRALADLVGKAQDSLDAGHGFADVAKANSLAIVETAPLTATGLNPDQPDAKPVPELQPLLAAGFKTNPDDAPSLQTIQQGERYALLGVSKVVPAAPKPIAQVKDQVAKDFEASRASDRAKAIATAIQAKINAGTPIADAFKAAPVKLPDVHPTAGRRMDLAQMQGHVPAPLAALFTSKVGGTKLVPAENGSGWYVVHVAKVTPADATAVAPAVAGSRNDLVQSASNEYLDQLATAAKQAVGVKRNESALALLQARLLGAAPAGQ
jgi:peptidyl-prolyl cis-trans isomerase D